MLSLVITVKNELKQLPEWLDSIKTQTRQPDEVVVVDGGSTDGTLEWLKGIAKPQIRIFQKIGNIASGRNFAVRAARGDLIAVTDAGCIYEINWLENLVAPIETGKTKFSTTAFKPWLKNDDAFLVRLIASATIPAAFEFNKDWLPSSRSIAFQKNVWEEAGGYPEWLPFCEDVLFDLELIKKGNPPFLIRDRLVSWRPRPAILSYLRQVYNYTRSDGHAKLFYHRQIVRYGVYGGFLAMTIFARQSFDLWIVPVAILGCWYMSKYWKRWLEYYNIKKIPRIVGIIVLPLIVAIGDVAKMVGFVVGVGERWIGKISSRI